MPAVASLQTDFYQVPLPVVLTDATHGAIPHFELVTVQLHDTDGATGSAIPTRSTPAPKPSPC
jgi:hypothetical protein